MEKVLISACLVGENTKYDGTNNYKKEVEQLFPLCDLILVCPEVFGGLSTPRAPSEIIRDRVVSVRGKDVTSAYAYGSELTLHIARQNGVRYALLKEGSPSCGSHRIADGTFSGKKIPGKGIAVRRLEEAGIRVFSEEEIPELIEALRRA